MDIVIKHNNIEKVLFVIAIKFSNEIYYIWIKKRI